MTSFFRIAPRQASVGIICMGFIFSYGSLAAAAGANGLCGPHEKLVFSCQMQKKEKQVALCASADLGKTSGYVQYRFGKPGAIELEFPASRLNTQKQFTYSHYFRYRVDLTTVSFKSGGYRYSVFHDYSDEMGENAMEQGVEIVKNGQENGKRLLCRNETVVNQLFTLEGVVPCDGDGALMPCRPE